MEKIAILSLFSLIIILGLLIFVNADTTAFTNVCCEKTNYGAFCQNSNPEKCDNSVNPFTKQNYRNTPTSCDATSYCKSGCCYNSQEGTCSENTPQLVCQQNNGTWADSASCEIPQCNLGCCILDNQAAYTTLTRCKKLAGFYGLNTNFRTDIKSETACIAIAQSQDRGACVFEEEFTRTCKFTTRESCENIKKSKNTGNGTITSNITFYKDYLCSAEELGTNCAPTTKTTCIEGKDEVYFVDSCGNPANIYDSSKLNDKSYWKKIILKAESCGYNSKTGNANSASCGNCDYFSGSFCRNYDRSKDKKPSYGDNICRDLNCYKTSDGNNYKHGESWCIYDTNKIGNGKDIPGTRYFKHVCLVGEELVEPCADFRQEVCIQDKITTDKGVFQQAGCAANEWQDCVSQKEKKDCENTDKRDCLWIEDVIGSGILGATSQNTAQQKSGGYQTNTFTTGSAIAPITGYASSDSESSTSTPTLKGGVCVPNYPTGLNFWTAGESQGICALANAQCEVTLESKGLFGGSPKPVKNGECLEDSWQKKNEQICEAIGDCQGSNTTREGVYKYLESGKSGVSGTGLNLFLSPFVKAGNYISGLAIFNNKSVNQGLIEDMRK